MWRDLRHASHFATQRATAGNGPARSNPGAEGPHPQPANSQKNPRGTAAATRARGPVSHPAGRRYADPPTGRKGQDDGHEWAEDRAAHSLSVVLFTSRTMVAGLSGMASGCAMVRQHSPGRTGDLSWRGSTRKSGIGGRHGPGTPASGSRPPCFRSAALSHGRNHSSTWAPKTQGRACLIARMLSLVILNSISMANGSPAAGSYSSANSSWTTSRCSLN